MFDETGLQEGPSADVLSLSQALTSDDALSKAQNCNALIAFYGFENPISAKEYSRWEAFYFGIRLIIIPFLVFHLDQSLQVGSIFDDILDISYSESLRIYRRNS